MRWRRAASHLNGFQEPKPCRTATQPEKGKSLADAIIILPSLIEKARMLPPFAAVRIRLARIGIARSLLGATLLAIVLAVGAVQAWTMHVVTRAERVEAQRRLETTLAVLKLEIGRIGSTWQLKDGQLTLDGVALNGRQDVIDVVGRVTGGAATIFADDTQVATNITGLDGRRAYGTTLAPGPARDATLGRGETYKGEAAIFGVPHLTIYEPVLDPVGRPVGILFVGVPLAQQRAALNALLWNSVEGAAVVALVVGALNWLALQAALRPLGQTAAAVRSIAGGNFDQPVPHTLRRDQIGEIGRAIVILQQQARQAFAFEQRASANREAQGRHQQAIARLTQDFGTVISGVLTRFGQAASQMRSAAASSAGAAEHTRQDMQRMVVTSEESSVSLTTVASATEELSASVGEIARQITGAATAALQAVTQAETAAETMRSLDVAASQIGDVVELINQIAGQTKLLALNATIEAARAGDAGKGFAVVAGEVKQLAAQTGQATGRIATQVAAIQSATADAVAAVRWVSGTIHHVSDAAAAIVAAVEQQGASTREIATRVQMVATATGGAADVMRATASTVSEAEANSRSVLSRAQEVSRAAELLREEVNQFVGVVRTNGQAHVRQYERMPGNGMTAHVRCKTHGTSSGVITDISLGGAAIACEWPCDVGAELVVELPGSGRGVAGRVVGARNGLLHVAFQQNAENLSQVEVALGIIGQAIAPRLTLVAP